MSKKISEFFPRAVKREVEMDLEEEEAQCHLAVKKIKIEPDEPELFDGYVKMEPEEHHTLELPPPVDEKILSEKFKKTSHAVKKITGKNGKEVKFQCRICEKILKYSGTAAKHVKKMHYDLFQNILICQICDRKFFDKVKFEEHKRLKHPNGKPEAFGCDICGKVFKGRDNLASHIRGHRPTVKCDICQAQVASHCLKGHKLRRHSTVKNFQCTFCQKGYTTKDALSAHEKTHTRVLNCEFCEKKFSCPTRLKRHVKAIHENPLSFSCEKCDKKFSRKDNLKAHQKQHDPARPKPFKCDKCDFATDEKRTFRDHLNSHIKEEERAKTMKNPVKCDICGKFSRNNTALRVHIKDVHHPIMHDCDICGKSIKGRKAMRDHIKCHLRAKMKENLQNKN